MKFTAKLGEIKAVHADLAGVGGLGDTQMLTVESDEIQAKLSLLLLATILEHNLEGGCFFVSPQNDLIVVAGKLEHF